MIAEQTGSPTRPRCRNRRSGSRRHSLVREGVGVRRGLEVDAEVVAAAQRCSALQEVAGRGDQVDPGGGMLSRAQQERQGVRRWRPRGARRPRTRSRRRSGSRRRRGRRCCRPRRSRLAETPSMRWPPRSTVMPGAPTTRPSAGQSSRLFATRRLSVSTSPHWTVRLGSFGLARGLRRGDRGSPGPLTSARQATGRTRCAFIARNLRLRCARATLAEASKRSERAG